ncbi:DNA adenine methylase [Methylobacterium sp. RAS18]|nr:DNA adenine methylase [Methylobacterium sp. RAS18]
MSRPIIRWAGSKRSIAKQLINRIPSSYGLYVEPFCGSAALYYELGEKRALLNDLNSKLINFYRHFQDEPGQLYDIISNIPVDKSSYYHIRNQFNSDISPVDEAAYFYFLNRNCFNGLYRTCKSGRFNVPYSESRNGRIHDRNEFISISAKLNKAQFSNYDFELCIRENLSDETFFFIDPPYAINYREPFAEYGSNVFGPKDIERVISCLRMIDERKGKFLFTYDHRLKNIFEIDSSWRISEINVRRNIAGFADQRKNAKELIISNFQIEE